jgi:hypothetical protein
MHLFGRFVAALQQEENMWMDSLDDVSVPRRRTTSPDRRRLPRGHWRSVESALATGALRQLEGLVARIFSVRKGELRALNRGTREVQVARQSAMYLAHVTLGLDYTACGLAFGRDRTTAAHACRRIEDMRDDPYLDAALSLIESAMKSPRTHEARR